MRMANGPNDGSASLAGTVLGRYAVGRLLGSGGMGVVYEATHRDLGRRVAIKTLRESYAASPESRRRFLREGQAAAQIRHANVADVFDVAIEEGCPYLVLEYLEGEDLASLVARESPLSLERTSDILVPVVAAVAAAHDLGIVHRDLKPQNIFLAIEHSGVVPKVLDFGISKLADAEASATLTGTGAVLGTPHYMSPEQAQGAEVVDGRSDQYSLGVVLYQCATGRRPLQGVPLYSLIQRTVHGDFPPPRQVHPSLPGAFEQVILQAMARDPERRFPSTRALGQALLPFASAGVRAAYAAELGSSGVVAVATPQKHAAADALSTTLGESVHARPVTGARQRRSVRLLLGASVLAAAVAWGLLAQSPVEPAPSPVAAPEAQVADALNEPPSSTQALRPAGVEAPPQAARAREADSAMRANALVAEAEQQLTRGQLALAVTSFRRAYAVSLDPEVLRRGADAQTRLWRSQPEAERCDEARDLWSAYLAVGRDPLARDAARAVLTELGECRQPAAVAPSPTPVARRPAPGKPTSTPAASAPREPPAPPSTSPQAPATAAPIAAPLPSDDPLDGLMDIEPEQEPRGR